MSKGYQKRSLFANGTRDGNESRIIEIIERFRVPYCKMPPSAGFDLLVCVSPMECWEVKNPSYKWSLTKAEKQHMDYCKRNDITYRVVEYIDQAADALSAALEHHRERKTK